MTERLAKVELNIISLAFHANTNKQPPLGVQVQPKLSREVITKMHWIQFHRRPSDIVMVAKCVVVPYRSDQVDRPLNSNVEGLIPARVEIAMDNAGLVEAFLILVTKDDVGVTKPVRVASFEIFGLHDLDCEGVLGRFLGLLPRTIDSVDDGSAAIWIHLALELIELLHCVLDVVKFDKRLSR